MPNQNRANLNAVGFQDFAPVSNDKSIPSTQVLRLNLELLFSGGDVVLLDLEISSGGGPINTHLVSIILKEHKRYLSPPAGCSKRSIAAEWAKTLGFLARILEVKRSGRIQISLLVLERVPMICAIPLASAILK